MWDRITAPIFDQLRSKQTLLPTSSTWARPRPSGSPAPAGTSSRPSGRREAGGSGDLDPVAAELAADRARRVLDGVDVDVVVGSASAGFAADEGLVRGDASLGRPECRRQGRAEEPRRRSGRWRRRRPSGCGRPSGRDAAPGQREQTRSPERRTIAVPTPSGSPPPARPRRRRAGRPSGRWCWLRWPRARRHQEPERKDQRGGRWRARVCACLPPSRAEGRVSEHEAPPPARASPPGNSQNAARVSRPSQKVRVRPCGGGTGCAWPGTGRRGRRRPRAPGSARGGDRRPDPPFSSAGCPARLSENRR